MDAPKRVISGLTRSACLSPDEQVDIANFWAEAEDLLKRHTAHEACCTCKQGSTTFTLSSCSTTTIHEESVAQTVKRTVPSCLLQAEYHVWAR